MNYFLSFEFDPAVLLYLVTSLGGVWSFWVVRRKVS